MLTLCFVLAECAPICAPKLKKQGFFAHPVNRQAGQGHGSGRASIWWHSGTDTHARQATGPRVGTPAHHAHGQVVRLIWWHASTRRTSMQPTGTPWPP